MLRTEFLWFLWHYERNKEEPAATTTGTTDPGYGLRVESWMYRSYGNSDDDDYYKEPWYHNGQQSELVTEATYGTLYGT